MTAGDFADAMPALKGRGEVEKQGNDAVREGGPMKRKERIFHRYKGDKEKGFVPLFQEEL